MSEFFSSWGEDPMSEYEILFWNWYEVIEYFKKTGRSPDVVMEVFRLLDDPVRNSSVTASISPKKSAAPFRIETFLDEGPRFDNHDYSDSYDDYWHTDDDDMREYFENLKIPKDTSIHMSTIKGNSKFKYEGSVEEGTKIIYGKYNSSKFVSKEIYQELLKNFSGQIIQLDYPPKEGEAPNNLRNWLHARAHIRLLSKYIPSILIKEGYAELLENSTNTLKILD
ncbi:hypothetical protein [Bacillus sp. FJAT-27445]|uniref:hypothetical protein n=1 Tax=Bacillus sp. FJAT-27445 TaxID=1679166 RepID=UPI0007437135|nr:hypothetical protein [Bacillus sp. FJAT-27445]